MSTKQLQLPQPKHISIGGSWGGLWDHRPLCGSSNRSGEAVLHVLKRFPICEHCLVELDRYQENRLIELGSTKNGDPMWIWRAGVAKGGCVDPVKPTQYSFPALYDWDRDALAEEARAERYFQAYPREGFQ